MGTLIRQGCCTHSAHKWAPNAAGVMYPCSVTKEVVASALIASAGKCYRSAFGEPKAAPSSALVVSVLTGNLTVFCLGFNLPVLLRKPGQSSFVCLVVHVTQKGNPAPLYICMHASPMFDIFDVLGNIVWICR